MADDADFAALNQERCEAEFLQRLRNGPKSATDRAVQRDTCLDCGVAIKPPNRVRCADCQSDVDRLAANRKL